jgi:nucleoid-associated protein YgaU
LLSQLEEVAIKIEEKKPEEVKPEPKPEPVIYKVVAGDNLTKIAKAHNTKWERIWDKNEKIQNQDMLEIGVELIIPLS